MGVEEHGEAGGSADRDGASDQCRYRAHGVGEARLLAPVQSQDAGRRRSHPDRDAQFEHINARRAVQAAGQPVISVDTKKKELIGNFKKRRHRLSAEGRSAAVNVHDFEDKNLGKVVPYGVYDIGRQLPAGSASASPATPPSSRWQRDPAGGSTHGPGALCRRPGELMITADGGGTNGSRLRLWKVELQKLADETGLAHPRLPLSRRAHQVEQDRAPAVLPHHAELARPPLTDRFAVVELIGATTTKTGLKVEDVLDAHLKGIRVANAAMKCLDIIGDRSILNGLHYEPGHPDNRSTYCSCSRLPVFSPLSERPATQKFK